MRNLANLCSVPDPLPETVHLPVAYFQRRGIRFDAPGLLNIAADSRWGYLVTLICRTHDQQEAGIAGKVEFRPITVESGAWICSGALLYNCTVGKNSVVAAGTVLRSQVVGPGVMVAGNPAKIIARWEEGGWQYLPVANHKRFLY